MGVDDENFSAALRAFSEWWDHSQHDSTIMAVIRDFQVKTADLARKAFLAGYAAGKKEKDRTKVPPAIPKGIQDKVNRESKKRVLRPRDVSEIFGIPKGTLANMR